MDINKQKHISYLFLQYLKGVLSEEEGKELDAWRKERPEHEEIFRRMSSRSYLLKKMHCCEVGNERHEILWKQIRQRCNVNEKRIMRRRWMQRVAVFVLPLVLGSVLCIWQSEMKLIGKTEMKSEADKVVLLLENGRKVVLDENESFAELEKLGEGIVFENECLDYTGSKKMKEVKYHLIQIPKGGEYSLVLADGSRVYLNAESQLKFPVAFIGDERKVYLKGEAYFDVAKNEGKPFIVETDEVKVEVLGTEFDVRAYEEEEVVSTTLVDGKVKVWAGDRDIALLPSEQAVWTSSEEKLEVRQVDVERYVGWKNGRLVFDKTPIHQIMDEMERWYDLKVEYRKEELKNETFSLNIEKYDDFKQILNLLEATGKVNFIVSENTIIVY